MPHSINRRINARLDPQQWWLVEQPDVARGQGPRGRVEVAAGGHPLAPHLHQRGGERQIPADQPGLEVPIGARGETPSLLLAFDDEALYISARMYDREPARVVRQLSRRDSDAESDAITIYLDPQHDHRTGVMLRVSAAGSLADALISDDNSEDSAWDGVWDAAVASDDQGWTAELRVPFSQLRFTPGARQTWGLNARRTIQRNNEDAWWVLCPRPSPGSRRGWATWARARARQWRDWETARCR